MTIRWNGQSPPNPTNTNGKQETPIKKQQKTTKTKSRIDHSLEWSIRRKSNKNQRKTTNTNKKTTENNKNQQQG